MKQSFNIRSIHKETLHEKVAQELERYILTSRSEKERLPTEAELSERYGVSRTVVREALKVLKDRGLVSMCARQGLFITKPEISSVSSALFRIVRFNNISDHNISQVRIILETAACREAALNACKSDVAEMEHINHDMIEAGNDIPLRVGKDCDLHLAIARASGNELLVALLSSIMDLLRDYITRRIMLYPQGNRDGIEFHAKIIHAIKSADPVCAEQLMREHLTASSLQYN